MGFLALWKLCCGMMSPDVTIVHANWRCSTFHSGIAFHFGGSTNSTFHTYLDEMISLLCQFLVIVAYLHNYVCTLHFKPMAQWKTATLPSTTIRTRNIIFRTFIVDATLVGWGMAPIKQHHHGTKMTFKMANAHFQASRLQAGDNAAASGMWRHFLGRQKGFAGARVDWFKHAWIIKNCIVKNWIISFFLKERLWCGHQEFSIYKVNCWMKSVNYVNGLEW